MSMFPTSTLVAASIISCIIVIIIASIITAIAVFVLIRKRKVRFTEETKNVVLSVTTESSLQ